MKNVPSKPYEMPLTPLAKKNRFKVQANDIFALEVLNYGYFYGRVVKIDLDEIYTEYRDNDFIFMPGEKKCWICCYIYDFNSDYLVEDISQLVFNNLLCGPLLLTNHAWRDGLFKTIGNVPIPDHEQALHTNCFYWRCLDRYVDMHGQFLDKPVMPCGKYGSFLTHHGIYSILREALGDPIIYNDEDNDGGSDDAARPLDPSPMPDYPEEIRIELNGTDLPDEVYEQCDLLAIDEILEEIDEEEVHFVAGNSERTDTAVLYRVFCVSAKKSWEMMQQALSAYPLCQKAIVSLIDRNGEVMQRLTIGE
ncbi:MAG: Imm26 family immunity protein [Phycisphaeraceae bacterium]